MVDDAQAASGTHHREATKDVWWHPPLRALQIESEIRVARRIRDRLVAYVANVDENDDGFSSQILSFFEADINLHLRPHGGSREQQEQGAPRHGTNERHASDW